MKTVEATRAAENFSRVLNQVRSLHESFRIVEKGVPFAYLIPAGNAGCSSHELADELAGADLSFEDRRKLAEVIRKGRKTQVSVGTCEVEQLLA